MPLPAHAPKNASYGWPTGYRSFLGGSVYQWVDSEGRDLGRTNAVPVNMHGERTKIGVYVTPGKKILSDRHLLMHRLRDEHGGYWANPDYWPTLFRDLCDAKEIDDPRIWDVRAMTCAETRNLFPGMRFIDCAYVVIPELQEALDRLRAEC